MTVEEILEAVDRLNPGDDAKIAYWTLRALVSIADDLEDIADVLTRNYASRGEREELAR